MRHEPWQVVAHRTRSEAVARERAERRRREERDALVFVVGLLVAVLVTTASCVALVSQ